VSLYVSIPLGIVAYILIGTLFALFIQQYVEKGPTDAETVLYGWPLIIIVGVVMGLFLLPLRLIKAHGDRLATETELKKQNKLTPQQMEQKIKQLESELAEVILIRNSEQE